MRIARVVVGVVAGLIAAELIVRLVTAPELDYQSFARPGLYCYDEVLNLVPSCAGSSLMMRVPGEERYVAAPLNQWGFRGPYVNLSRGDHVVKRILLVGGMSQGFGAGLAEDETYAAEAARGSCGSVEIHNVAMPGAGAEVTWNLAERRLFGELHFDHVIFALYERLGHPDIAGRLVPAADQVADLAALNGLEFRFSRRLRGLRSSALLVRSYDLLARAELELKWWEPRLTGKSTVEGPRLREQESLAELMQEVRRRSAERGAAFSVLLLPWHGDTSDAQLRKLLPDVRFVDAHTAVRTAPPDDAYFPDGHYKLPVTRIIGRMVADEICAVDFPKK
jgi:hypothetical protein